jgi:hypothetical protein
MRKQESPTVYMMRVRKSVDPQKESILVSTVSPVMKSKGMSDYICGSCSTVLLSSVSYKQVQHIVVKCPECGSYNDIPPAHHTH